MKKALHKTRAEGHKKGDKERDVYYFMLSGNGLSLSDLDL